MNNPWNGFCLGVFESGYGTENFTNVVPFPGKVHFLLYFSSFKPFQFFHVSFLFVRPGVQEYAWIRHWKHIKSVFVTLKWLIGYTIKVKWMCGFDYWKLSWVWKKVIYLHTNVCVYHKEHNSYINYFLKMKSMLNTCVLKLF